jgi:hypothetical protein
MGKGAVCGLVCGGIISAAVGFFAGNGGVGLLIHGGVTHNVTHMIIGGALVGGGLLLTAIPGCAYGCFIGKKLVAPVRDALKNLQA